jgi:hypothetical protein
VQHAATKRARDENRRVIFVNAVLWDAVRVAARAEHRTLSAVVTCALEAWLGWDEES